MGNKKLKSKIDYKEADMDAFDGKKFPSSYLSDEFGQWAALYPNFNYHEIIKKAKDSGKSIELKFSKPKKQDKK